MRMAAALPIMLLPFAAPAEPAPVNECVEMLKLRDDSFLCLKNSSGSLLGRVALYDHGRIVEAPNGFYTTLSGKYFLVEDSKPLPLASTSYLRDGKRILFFDDVDHHTAYFCEDAKPVTRKESATRNVVAYYERGACTRVPDGSYQTKSSLSYIIRSGEPELSERDEYLTCFHTWKEGAEALECEDRD